MPDIISTQTAQILLDIKAVVLSPRNPIRFTSGILSPIYVDNRLLCSHVDARERIVSFLVRRMREENLPADVVAGTATAGIPHAAWIAQKADIPMVYVRSKPKEHGMGKQIEGGILSSDQQVLVVEDLVSTGKSSLITIDAIRKEGGAQCSHVLAIYSHQMQKATDAFAAVNVTLTTLTNFSDLIEVAIETGYLEKSDKELILEWNKNPQAWTEKMESSAQP